MPPFLRNSILYYAGLVKVLTCKETDKILGVWILGQGAGIREARSAAHTLKASFAL